MRRCGWMRQLGCVVGSLILVTYALGRADDLSKNETREVRPVSRPTNVVFFLVDDLGWRDIGAFGSTFYETPHVDRLVSQGMRFTDAYAACPVCSPTRASIMTGKYPARLNTTDFFGGPQPERVYSN